MMRPGRHGPHVISNLTKDAIEVDRDSSLYFVCFPEGFKPPPLPPPRPIGGDDDVGGRAGAELFCGTDEYVYQHFFADFGPLHLGHVWAFCRKLGALERQQGQQHEKGGGDRCEEKKKPVYVYSSDHPHRRSNAVVLVVAYAVLCLRKTVEDAYTPFLGVQPPLIPYRDASFGICTYHLEVLDCARALSRAASLGHFDLGTFNADQYAFYDKIENGDLNWIIPGKFAAFSGPLTTRREVEPGKRTLLAEDYVPIFRKLGITCVVRFNKRCYDRRRFTEGGIRHVDLFYVDGGNPSEEILQKFLKICETTKASDAAYGAIAVHCKAGLGRTGTNIALYMMKHYGYTAAESIALCRICRPGSIVGPQQQFLHDLEHRMKKEGDEFRLRRRSGGQGPGASAGAAGGVGSPSGAATTGVSPPLSHPGSSHRAERRHPNRRHQRYSREDSGASGVGQGGERPPTSVPTGRRPTTSPLLMRRHSTAYSGGGGGVRGRYATGPLGSGRRNVGWRWDAVEEGLEIRGGGGGGGSGGGGVRSINGGNNRGRGRGRRPEGLQRPRRGSSPSARMHNGGGVSGGGEADVGDLMGSLRLDGVNGAAAGGGSGGGSTDRSAAVGASTARGKLAPLAAPSVRPTTSASAVRNGRRLSAPALRPEELTRTSAADNAPVATTTSPYAGKPVAASGSGGASRSNRSSVRAAAARRAVAPGKASLAWQHPVDRNSSIGRSERDGQHGNHALGGGSWEANDSPSLGVDARETHR
ncbi:unnamed protein product [Ectocarpus sp. 12 AP-2014]